jgi:hypothetical protein
MKEHQEHKGSPFTIKVFALPRNGEIVGRVFELKCVTCGEEKTKAVESLNSLDIKEALDELFEESRLHASYHDDTSDAE